MFVMGGALLVGAAAGYALIAFRFKNMHAGTRGSGGAEVGYGAPRAPSCTRSATPARAPLHPSHCASADASGGDIQQASEPRCEYRLERRGTRGGTTTNPVQMRTRVYAGRENPNGQTLVTHQ